MIGNWVSASIHAARKLVVCPLPAFLQSMVWSCVERSSWYFTDVLYTIFLQYRAFFRKVYTASQHSFAHDRPKAKYNASPMPTKIFPRPNIIHIPSHPSLISPMIPPPHLSYKYIPHRQSFFPLSNLVMSHSRADQTQSPSCNSCTC